MLVHGDPQLYPLTATFPEAAGIADKLLYTGYVAEAVNGAAPASEAASLTEAGDVVVSVGGGVVGEPLLRSAIAARPLTQAAKRVWRVITGPNLSNAVYDDLAWNAPSGVIVERWRDDLPQLLRQARLSISQGGYNTMMDILNARVGAVIVPFAAPGETEQTFRAQALAARGVVTLLEADQLTSRALAAAVDQALAQTPATLAVDMDGAAATAKLVSAWCRQPPVAA